MSPGPPEHSCETPVDQLLATLKPTSILDLAIGGLLACRTFVLVPLSERVGLGQMEGEIGKEQEKGALIGGGTYHSAGMIDALKLTWIVCSSSLAMEHSLNGSHWRVSVTCSW